MTTARAGMAIATAMLILTGCGSTSLSTGPAGDTEEEREEEEVDDEEGEEPEEPDEPEDPVAELIDEYDLAGFDCEESDPVDGATAAVWCDYGGTDYELHRFPSQGALRTAFSDWAAEEGLEPRTWRQDTTGGARGGSMFSYVDPDIGAVLVWTQESSLVLGVAWWVDDDDLVGLEEWWSSDGSVIDGDPVLPAEPDPLALLVAGDCVGFEAGTPYPLDCSDDAAEAEVLTVSDSEDTECASVSDRSYWAQTTDTAGRTQTVHLCLVTLVDAAADGVLQIGSCVELIDTSDESVDVYELHCDDDAVTHDVIADVPEGKDCPKAADYTISKSDTEVEDSGAGRWCMAER